VFYNFLGYANPSLLTTTVASIVNNLKENGGCFLNFVFLKF
jgi:hypothetical protein